MDDIDELVNDLSKHLIDEALKYVKAEVIRNDDQLEFEIMVDTGIEFIVKLMTFQATRYMMGDTSDFINRICEEIKIRSYQPSSSIDFSLVN